ncbi:hypothetical protein JXB27_03090 [Candidatus Woesearchaeota archaeon]|nr:hypothetical protein [Candidatus Woesearchaeota archaeon]
MKTKLTVDRKLFFEVFGYSLLLFLIIVVLSNGITLISEFLASKLSVETESSVAFALFMFFFLTGAFFFLAFWAYSFIENTIWSRIMKKKTEKTLKFFLLNAVMVPIVVVLVFLFSWLFAVKLAVPVVSAVLFFTASFICGYLLYFSYAAFTAERKIGKTLKLTFTKGFKEIKNVYLILIIAAVFAFVLDIFSFILAESPVWLSYSFDLIVLSAYAAWFQIVLGNALKSAKL